MTPDQIQSKRLALNLTNALSKALDALELSERALYCADGIATSRERLEMRLAAARHRAAAVALIKEAHIATTAAAAL